MEFEFYCLLYDCSLGTQYFTFKSCNHEYTYGTLKALHNVYGPAFIGIKGREKLTIEHHINGLLHREVNPAVTIFEDLDWINLNFFMNGELTSNERVPVNVKIYENIVIEETYRLSKSTMCTIFYFNDGKRQRTLYKVGCHIINEREWINMGLKNIITKPFKLRWIFDKN